MELHVDGLELQLRPSSPFDSEGWGRVSVRMAVPGFEGEYVAWVGRGELEHFNRQLQALIDSLEPGAAAVLDTMEQEIFLEFTMDHSGHIIGTYRFRSANRLHGPVQLTGSIELDQSYLPSLVGGIRELLSELSGSL